MKYQNIREEELKNKIAQNYFWQYDCIKTILAQNFFLTYQLFVVNSGVQKYGKKDRINIEF